MNYKVSQERKRGLNLTSTRYDNWALFIKSEINRMMKCICIYERWFASNDCLYTFIITLTELNLEVDLRINFNEFNRPDEVITSIIREVKNKAIEKIMS